MADTSVDSLSRWVPFNRQRYKWEWQDSGIKGIFGQFKRDLKYCYQRIKYGYCEYDLFAINSWFLDIIPRMLETFRKNRNSSPVYDGYPGHLLIDQDLDMPEGTPNPHVEWNKTLAKMIHLFREANEDTCEKKNPYYDEHMKVFTEFEKKYGFFGEGLQTEEEKKEMEKTGGGVMHFARELPEYKEIEEKYDKEEREIEVYRKDCLKKAFELFIKNFDDLWD